MSDPYTRRRTQSTSVTTVISLSLLIFMLGFLGFMVLCAKTVSEYFKENIPFQVYLKDDAKDADIRRFQKSLETSAFVKSTEFISKEQALEIYERDVGEPFMQLLQENVLPASIDIHLNAAYANADSIEWIQQEIMQESIVKEFRYVENLVSKVNDNLGKISLIFLCGISLLALIAVALIYYTIRLAIYSKRFLIRTMQLVGATHGFISRPFLWSGILQGIFGAILGMGMLVGVIYLVNREIPELLKVLDSVLFTSLFALMLLAGIIISLASTFFAVRKYLRIKTDDLYN